MRGRSRARGRPETYRVPTAELRIGKRVFDRDVRVDDTNEPGRTAAEVKRAGVAHINALVNTGMGVDGVGSGNIVDFLKAVNAAGPSTASIAGLPGSKA